MIEIKKIAMSSKPIQAKLKYVLDDIEKTKCSVIHIDTSKHMKDITIIELKHLSNIVNEANSSMAKTIDILFDRAKRYRTIIFTDEQ